MKCFRIVIYGLCGLFLGACTHNPLKVNTSGVSEEVTVVRYDQAFFQTGAHPDSAGIAALMAKYPEFTGLFSYRVIKIGNLNDSAGRRMVQEFVSDSVIQLSKAKIEKLYSNHPEWEKKLIHAFKYYRYYFPERKYPLIYSCISGFNESVFVSGNIIGVSLDKYLGSDCPYYPLLGLPKYKQHSMIPEMIPRDVIQAWARSQFPMPVEATTLCDFMVYEGKILYFTEALDPDMADTLLTAYSAGQLKWCRKNESGMWNYLIENNMLFSTRQMDIVRYINDGPTTNGFPPESPARTGAWLGWQIVGNYMKRHPEITIPQLMEDNNFQGILNASAYAP
jgi:hypothetical protein